MPALPKPPRLTQLENGWRFLNLLTATACQTAGVTAEQILAHRGPQPVAELRFLIWQLARQLTVLSSQDLADVFDYTLNNIIYGITRAGELLEADPSFRARAQQIKAATLKLYGQKEVQSPESKVQSLK